MTLKDMYLLLHTTYGHNNLFLLLPYMQNPKRRHGELDKSTVTSCSGRILCIFENGKWYHHEKPAFRNFDSIRDLSSQCRNGIELTNDIIDSLNALF